MMPALYLAALIGLRVAVPILLDAMDRGAP